MIYSFAHKGLRELYCTGQSALIATVLHGRCLQILDALHAAHRPEDLRITGWELRRLSDQPARFSALVAPSWYIVFELEDGIARRVNLFEQIADRLPESATDASAASPDAATVATETAAEMHDISPIAG